MNNEILLSVTDLRMWFELRRWGFLRAGFVKAVDGVTFDLRRGEAIAIVGESGCGKSTLARTILGLHIPTGGEILFNGQSLGKRRSLNMRKYRSQIGFVQQDPYGALASFMTVHRSMSEPMIISGVKSKDERERRIRHALQEVRLTPADDYLPKFPHMLSGGQQQRVVIARAMILEPKLILADEPVSMLDVSVRVEVLELMHGLQKARDLGLIYITHDLSTVRYFTEHVFVMYGAKLVEKSSVKQLLHNTLHPYSQALLAAIPDADAKNATTFREVPSGEPPSLLHPPSGCRYHPRCDAFIKDRCDVEEPPGFEPEKGHLVACWLYG